MPYEFHVTCGETKSKKLITVDNKENLVEKIKERFSVANDIIIQRSYLDDWLDVEDADDVPDSGKVVFLKKPMTSSSTAEKSENCASESHIPVVPLPTGFGMYKLPTFPADIAKSLTAGSVSIATCRADRSRIVQSLYDDLRARVGLYASNQDVRTVCSTLVMTYPCLQDKVKIGQSTARYHTWFESLRQKMKDKRRSLTSDEQVLQMKAKYGGRSAHRRTSNPLDITETPRSKTPRLAIASVDDCGEDERSVEQHIATMQQQMGKAHCDFSVVGDRMIRTYSHRRDVITSGSKLSEVLEMYPALKDQAQLQAEFIRMTRVNMVETLQHFWTAQRLDIATARLQGDKVARDIVSGVLETNVLGCLCYHIIADDKRDMMIHALPRLFGEQLLCWSLITDADDDVDALRLSVYPTVVICGNRLSVYFERTKICHCANMTEAAATLVMVYYVFDVEYPRQLANTYNFLDACVGQIDKKLKVRPSVQRKINILIA